MRGLHAATACAYCVFVQLSSFVQGGVACMQRQPARCSVKGSGGSCWAAGRMHACTNCNCVLSGGQCKYRHGAMVGKWRCAVSVDLVLGNVQSIYPPPIIAGSVPAVQDEL